MAVKLGTTGVAGKEKPVLPQALRQSVEDGLYRYLASDPICKADKNRHQSGTSLGDHYRSGGPTVPVPDSGNTKCHHIHLYTAAQNDSKISDIELSPGPRTTWKNNRSTDKALNPFLDTIKPLTGLVEAMFRAIVPEMWEMYDKVYRILPVHNTIREVKASFGIWTSRVIVLNALTDMHIDLKDVVQGFCAIVPLGKFSGGNVCLPTLGISIPLAAGKFPIFVIYYFS